MCEEVVIKFTISIYTKCIWYIFTILHYRYFLYHHKDGKVCNDICEERKNKQTTWCVWSMLYGLNMLGGIPLMKQKLCMSSSLFLRKSSDGQSWSELRAGLVLDRWLVTFPTPIQFRTLRTGSFAQWGRFQASHGRGGHIRLKAASWSTPRSSVSPDKGCNSISEGGKEGGYDEAQRPGEKRREEKEFWELIQNGKNTSRGRIENNFNHFASKRKRKKKEDEGSWFWRMTDKQEEEPSCFLASFSICLFSLTTFFLISLSFPLCVSSSLKMAADSSHFRGQAHFLFVL